MRVLSIRVGRSGAGHHHSGILCQRNNPLRTSFHGIEGNEVASLGLQPGTDLQSAELLFQNLFHRFKLRTHNRGMLLHMLPDSFQIFEIPDVTELIQLIMADGLNGHLLFDILQIIIRSGNSRNAGTRKADLRCGAEFIYQIRISGFFTFMQNFQDIILIIVVQVMYIIGIVPVDAEILSRGLQPCEPAYRFIRISDALRIGILGNTPDSLNRRIFAHKLLHHIHVRAFRSHGNVDHLNPKILRNREMPVVTGHRAEELHDRKLAPGRTAADAMRHGTRHRIIHDIQAGIAIDDDLVGGNLDQIGKKLLGFLNTVDHTIVSAVNSFPALQIGGAVQHIHHSHGNVKLLRRRLSSGHIQLQAHSLKFFIFRFQFFTQGFQFFSASVVVRLHLFLFSCRLKAALNSCLNQRLGRSLFPAAFRRRLLYKKEAD